MAPSKKRQQLSLLSWLFKSQTGLDWQQAETSVAERLLREHLKNERARLRRGPGAGGDNVEVRAGRNRFAKAHSRKILKSVRKRPRRKLGKEVLVARWRSSPILDRLIPDRQENWTGILRRPVLDSVPALRLKNFSFLDNPNETLRSIKRIGELERSVLQALIHFEDEYCLDAGAYLVLAEIWPQMARIFEGGQMSRPVQKVLHATGVGRNNKMSLRAAERDVEFILDGKHADIWASPLQRRRPALSSRSATVHLDPQTREQAADRFCKAINEWLGVPEINQELTKRGKGWIAGIVGELLCNAERHSRAQSNDGDWATTAFMVQRDGAFRCYMAFLSIGRSFTESLSDAAPDIKGALQGYLKRHWSSGFSDEALSTVFALQDAITCDPVAREQRSGGTGLQDVLEFVQVLVGPDGGDAQVAIISGKACIQLRRPYLYGQRRGEGHPRLLWCNQANSSEDPPDSDFVSTLEEHFAGTLVSVAFTLDPAYLASLLESADDGDDQPGETDGAGEGA